MNIQVLTAIAGDGTDKSVAVPRFHGLLLNGVGGTFDLRTTAGSTEYVTFPADTPIALGPFDGQTVHVRAAEGVSVQVALI
jgi:hypothetical protein